jgi:5'-3' exoribonuclease 2
MGVLPAASAHALPAAYGPLMTEPSSPIVDFYPTDFESDMNGKRFTWQAVTLLPWIEEKRLLAAIATVEPTLTEEERFRNSCRLETVFVRATHPLGAQVLALEAAHKEEDGATRAAHETAMDAAASGGMNGRVVLLPGPACPPFMPSPVEGMPSIPRNAVVGVAYKLPPPRFVPPRLPEGALLPDPIVAPGDIKPPPTLWHEEPFRGPGGPGGPGGFQHGGGRGGGPGGGGYGGPPGGYGGYPHGPPGGGGYAQHGQASYGMHVQHGQAPPYGYGMPQHAYAQQQQQQQGAPALASAAHRLLQRSMQFAAGGGLSAGAQPFVPGGAPQQGAYAQQGYMQAQPAFGAPQQYGGAPYGAAPYGGGYGYGAPQQQQPWGGYAQPHGYPPPQQQQQQQQQQQAPPGGDNRFGVLNNLPRRDPRARQ